MTHRALDPARLGDHLDRLFRAAWATVRIARGRGGPRAGHLRARARAPAVPARRGRPRLPAARAAQHPHLAAAGGGHAAPSAWPSPRRRPEPEDTRTAWRPDEALDVGQIFPLIAALPDAFRDALVAVDVCGLSYGEAGKALGVREATITTRLYRARRQVAEASALGRGARAVKGVAEGSGGSRRP